MPKNNPIKAAQTTLKITNRSGAEVKVYLTLGAAAGAEYGPSGRLPLRMRQLHVAGETAPAQLP